MFQSKTFTEEAKQLERVCAQSKKKIKKSETNCKKRIILVSVRFRIFQHQLGINVQYWDLVEPNRCTGQS